MANQAFTDACGFTMPLGKHKGKTLARIGSNDEGLKYLDWLIGQEWVNGPLKTALKTYLTHPAIGRQLGDAMDEEQEREEEALDGIVDWAGRIMD